MKRALGMFMIGAPGTVAITTIVILTGEWVPLLIPVGIIAAIVCMAYGFMLVEDKK